MLWIPLAILHFFMYTWWIYDDLKKQQQHITSSERTYNPQFQCLSVLWAFLPFKIKASPTWNWLHSSGTSRAPHRFLGKRLSNLHHDSAGRRTQQHLGQIYLFTPDIYRPGKQWFVFTSLCVISTRRARLWSENPGLFLFVSWSS